MTQPNFEKTRLAAELIRREVNEHDRAQILAFAAYLRAESRKRRTVK